MNKLNALIMMAGKGERFSKEAKSIPKPLIKVKDKYMIEAAIESLNIDANYIFVIKKYKEENYNKELMNILLNYTKINNIIITDVYTEGPAKSAMLAEALIDNDEPIIITNCDQILEWDSKKFIDFISSTNAEGVVVTYKTNTPKNSYISLDENGEGLRVAEKEVISNHSLNGVHFYKRGSFFVDAAKKMFDKKEKVNNEYYISLTYNELIKDGMKILNYEISPHEHWAIGTPEDLQRYLSR